MNITVFCSSKNIPEIYTGPAVTFARLLAGNGHTLVWGGSDTGLMKQIADAVQEKGGKIIGITVEILKNVSRKNADKMIIARTMGERKELLLENGDVIVVLVGGLGTLAEFTEIADLKKLGVHKKPIIVLNTNNFYNDLINQFNRMFKEGFLPTEINSLCSFVNTPQEVMSLLEKYR